jgi:hypothetical protein
LFLFSFLFVFKLIFFLKNIIHQFPESELKTLKLIEICDNFKMEKESQIIKKVFAIKKLKENRIINSIYWFLLTNDKIRLSQISNFILNNLINNSNQIINDFQEFNFILNNIQKSENNYFNNFTFIQFYLNNLILLNVIILFYILFY